MPYFLQHKPSLGKLREKHSSSEGLPYSSANYLIRCSPALLHTQRPAPGASDLVDLGKATEQDNTDTKNFPRDDFVLRVVLKVCVIETVPHLSNMMPACYFVNCTVSCSVQCWSRSLTIFSHLLSYCNAPFHFSVWKLRPRFKEEL